MYVTIKGLYLFIYLDILVTKIKLMFLISPFFCFILWFYNNNYELLF